MAQRYYKYVGPIDIRDKVLVSSPAGAPIQSLADLKAWIASCASDWELDGSLIATYVINVDGVLLLANRRSEHVACAGGDLVLSAGEVTFAASGDVIEISNQSTGYCPDLDSWYSVEQALDAIRVERPGCFTKRVVFRLCPSCDERNIVKDAWFVCDLCGADLPENWNFT